jgi:hypothetical protein
MCAKQFSTCVTHMHAVPHLLAVIGALELLCNARRHIYLCPVLSTVGLAYTGDEREAALNEFYEEWKDEVLFACSATTADGLNGVCLRVACMCAL